jgi:hypothetical protein
MRFIFGIIVGCALTIAGAYIADAIAASGPTDRMVNWEVVAKHVQSATALAREGWKRITG